MHQLQRISKTRLCFEWVKTGKCQYGDKCKFTHGECLSVVLLRCSISEALDVGDMLGRNRKNQEMLREQSSIRQSLRNRENMLQQYSEIHLDSFKLSKSCMIDRYYTQLFAADLNGQTGNDVSRCLWAVK